MDGMEAKVLRMVMVLFFGLLFFPDLAPSIFAGEQTERKEETTQIVLGVKDMSCLSCAATVKKSLKRLKGVKEVKVTLDPPEAVVAFTPAEIKVEDLIRATTNAGYPSTVKPRK